MLDIFHYFCQLVSGWLIAGNRFTASFDFFLTMCDTPLLCLNKINEAVLHSVPCLNLITRFPLWDSIMLGDGQHWDSSVDCRPDLALPRGIDAIVEACECLIDTLPEKETR